MNKERYNEICYNLSNEIEGHIIYTGKINISDNKIHLKGENIIVGNCTDYLLEGNQNMFDGIIVLIPKKGIKLKNFTHFLTCFHIAFYCFREINGYLQENLDIGFSNISTSTRRSLKTDSKDMFFIFKVQRSNVWAFITLSRMYYCRPSIANTLFGNSFDKHLKTVLRKTRAKGNYISSFSDCEFKMSMLRYLSSKGGLYLGRKGSVAFAVSSFCEAATKARYRSNLGFLCTSGEINIDNYHLFMSRIIKAIRKKGVKNLEFILNIYMMTIEAREKLNGSSLYKNIKF